MSPGPEARCKVLGGIPDPRRARGRLHGSGLRPATFAGESSASHYQTTRAAPRGLRLNSAKVDDANPAVHSGAETAPLGTPSKGAARSLVLRSVQGMWTPQVYGRRYGLHLSETRRSPALRVLTPVTRGANLVLILPRGHQVQNPRVLPPPLVPDRSVALPV